MEEDYYSILGASKSASQDEIEHRYKHLAMRHHPDRGGDVEEMKAINEAYRVLGNAASRLAYDSQHQTRDGPLLAVEPPLSPPSALMPDTVTGRLVGAFFFLLAGMVFLFLVRIFYIRFMWPIFLVATLVVILGVWKVHAVVVFARSSLKPSHWGRRYLWVQELVFWFLLCSGAYGIYLLMSEI